MPRIRQTRTTKSARGEECALIMSPWCLSPDTETTVLCHLNSIDKGVSIKSPDWWAVYGCHNCHAIIDGRLDNVTHELPVDITPNEILRCIMRGLYRTWKRQKEKGIIQIV